MTAQSYQDEREHTWATYPKADADLWVSFLSLKKLIFLNGSTFKFRPNIVKDPWLTGLDPEEFPGGMKKMYMIKRHDQMTSKHGTA